MKYYLAIESSCDETSIAILKDKKVLSNIILSQINFHKNYFGVIPELASRLHYESIDLVLLEALKEANIELSDLSKIYYTNSPGLSGSLFVGTIFAETLAWILNIEAVGINHLYAHLFSANIEHVFKYPMLGLIISGGHTATYLIESPLDIKMINSTRDDAVGECFDKIGSLLGLKYPAGPMIDKLSKKGNKNLFLIPKPVFKNNDDAFSFSGIKSFMNNFLKANINIKIEDVCATFQESIIKILMNNLKCNYEKYKPEMITICGGVSSNSRLREISYKTFNFEKNVCVFPSAAYSTDNAAMVGFYGIIKDQEIKENNVKK